MPGLPFLALAAVILAATVPGAFAPFPADHPYNVFNPVIEPWWERLTKEEQKHIYGGWERVEPVALALAEAVEAKMRAKETLRRLVTTKASHLLGLIKEAYEATNKKEDRDGDYERGDSFKTGAQKLEEDSRAEAQEFLHWKQAAKGSKRIALLEKLNLLTHPDRNNRGNEVYGSSEKHRENL